MAGNVAPGAPAVPPLDPRLLRVIRESAAQLRGQEEEFIHQLQYDLATLIPDLAGLRTEDGWVFCERMVRALLWTATTDQPAALIAQSLRQLGAMNWQEGFPEAQYVSVAHALVRTVRDLSGYEWSTSYASAWISFFQWIRPHLVAGARQAAAPPAGVPQAGVPQAGPQQAGVPQAAQQAGSPPPAGSPAPSGPPAGSPPPAAPPAGRYPPAPPGPSSPNGHYGAVPRTGTPDSPYGAAGPPYPPGQYPAERYPAAGPTAAPPSAPGTPVRGRGRDLRIARPRRRAGEAELEAAAEMLHDEDEDDGPGITEIMLGMTRNRRQRPPDSG